MRYELMAPCHFGLEACTKREITDLGYEIASVRDGRVNFFGDERAVCRSNVFLRTPERILLQVCSFQAKSWEALFEAVYEQPWEDFLPWDADFWVSKASSVRSALFSPRDFQTIIQKAIVRRLQKAYHRDGLRLPMTGASYPLRVSAVNDEISIGLDTSGESLHKRGYRKMTAKAPIKETLAAALLMLTPWHPDRILLDPFCGSGTLLIEAAMQAAGIAPGMTRNFTATSWQNLIERQRWYDAYDEAREIRASADLKALKERLDLQGYDIDAEVLAAARENARLAGVEELIHFQQRPVAQMSHPKKYGFILTNPPYGERLEEKEDLPEIYRALGERFAAMEDWSLYMITSYEDAEKYIGRKADRNRKIYNGMIKTYFYSFTGKKPPAAGREGHQ